MKSVSILDLFEGETSFKPFYFSPIYVMTLKIRAWLLLVYVEELPNTTDIGNRTDKNCYCIIFVMDIMEFET